MEDFAGAFSQGPMVPVFQTNDAARAARAVANLDAAGIPALAASRALGMMLGPIPDGVSVIVVPRSQLNDARIVLEQTGLLTPGQGLALLSVASTPAEEPNVSIGSGGFEVPRPAVRRPPPIAPPVDDEEGPIEETPFESASWSTRLTVALGACAVGALLQAFFLSRGGFAAVRRLALSWDGTAFSGNAITAGFVHGSSTHFLANLGFGLLFGPVLIGTHGVGATAFVWLLASVLGIAAEAYLSPGAAVLGASAGLYGLVGLWLRGELQRASAAVLPRRARFRALGVILLLAPGALTPVTSSGSRVAVLAHLVGFAVGLAAGTVFPRWLSAEDRALRLQSGRWAFAFAAVVSAAGLSAAFLAV